MAAQRNGTLILLVIGLAVELSVFALAMFALATAKDPADLCLARIDGAGASNLADGIGPIAWADIWSRATSMALARSSRASRRWMAP